MVAPWRRPDDGERKQPKHTDKGAEGTRKKDSTEGSSNVNPLAPPINVEPGS
ncbi:MULTISPECIES: hypothetical protein [Sphingobium]|uniref:hypothetical protein n=1 Tax=Sphingobium TaxID=165695 RepID=UPI001BE8A563|nr:MULTISPECIES: hypothetical protein [Sphingobium]MBT2245028.1 hypothetical protein [Sphingobium sp. BHU LFT2]WBQ19388.1 hypothetical protein PAE53_23705 [Sphingobium yanoikuyae]